MIGRSLGPYQIVAKLGEGGMGEVYKARDTRLDRTVAIKVLPQSQAADPDFKDRFSREARAISALDHPHICALYDVGDQDGVAYLVMQHLEGETLQSRLHGRPLPVDQALAIAIQIADALEAAHERGIVHRDLKPGNVMLTRDDVAKVLDFGLAKDTRAVDARAAGETVTAATHAGMIVGTAAYMSPEQARGRPVDKRTDIWAYGCVLFEMLSGAHAFGGDTTTDVLAGVIERQPDWARLPESVPRRVRDLLRRCLQKDPKHRLHDIADARIELEEARRPGSDEPAAPVKSPPRSRALAWVVLGAVIAGAAFAGWRALQPLAAPPAPMRSTIVLPPDTTLSLGRGSTVAFAPDGRQIVFAASAKGTVRLYLRPLDRFEAAAIAGTEGATDPFFSPDGKWLGFFADGKLKKIGIDGSGAETLADAPAPRGYAWGPGETIYFTPRNNTGVWRVSAHGGKPEPATTTRTGELSHRWPQVLPGGALMFTVWNDTGWEPAQIAVQPPGGGEHKVILSGGGFPCYLPGTSADGGYLIYARAEGLMAARFDLSRLEITGHAVPVVDGALVNLSGGSHFSLSATGALAYVPGAAGETERNMVWVTRTGAATPLPKVFSIGRFFTLSPDGTRLVGMNLTPSSRDAFAYDLARGTSTRLSFRGDVFSAIWSQDGRHVVYNGGFPGSLYRVASDGTGREEQLTSSGLDHTPSSTSPDGRMVVYVDNNRSSGADIWVLTLDASGKPASNRPFLQTPFSEGTAKVSPDGKWLAYQSNESGRFEIYVQPFPDGGRKWQVSADGGLFPVWSSTGRELFFRTGTNLMAAAVTAAPDFQPEKPAVLFDARRYEVAFAVAPGGERLLMMVLSGTEIAAAQVQVVTNWREELRQRVP